MTEHNLTREVKITPAITAGAYGAGDVVGGLLTLEPLVNQMPGKAGGVIRRIMIADDDNEKAAMKLYIFNGDAAPTSIADNAAFAPVIADLKNLLEIVSFSAGDYTTLNGNAWAKQQVTIDFYASSGKLYVYVVCDATPTYTAATDLTFTFEIWLD